jgi:hypothetical protein
MLRANALRRAIPSSLPRKPQANLGDDYDTMIGLERMKRSCDNGRSGGLEIERLLKVTTCRSRTPS